MAKKIPKPPAAKRKSSVGNNEAWCKEPIANALSAAYHAGRLINFARFSVRQAAMLYAASMHEEAEWQLSRAQACLKYLAASAPIFGHKRDKKIREAGTRAMNKLKKSIGSEDHDYYLSEFYNCSDDWAESITGDEYRDELLKEFSDGPINALEESILEILDEQEHRAFRLGETLDSGIRPPRVYHRMFESNLAEKCVDAYLAEHKLQWDKLTQAMQFKILEAVKVPGNYLANVMRGAGELAPDNMWHFELANLMTAMSIPELPDEAWPTSELVRGGSLITLVQQLHNRTRRQLDGPGSQAPRLVVVPDDAGCPHAVLDGVPIPVSPDGALLLQRCIELKGDWICRENTPELMEHTGRIRKRLPEKLRMLVEAKAGNGHRIRLETLRALNCPT